MPNTTYKPNVQKKRKITEEARYWMNLKRENPLEFQHKQALKSIKIWKRNLKQAEEGEGFFKLDHCQAMLNLHLGRLVEGGHNAD